jgi:GT2 family glycosyltransferase
MTNDTTVAVVICAYTEDRWDDLLAAHRSMTSQTAPADEVVIVIDHNPALLTRLRQELPQARIVPNRGGRGLSGARNTGIEETSAEVVLFLDDDAAAESDWVAIMAAPFRDVSVVGVGGWAEPNWAAPGRPRWFPEPFLWVVGCSYEGLPTTQADIRNPIGSAMGFRRTALELVGGFSGSVGRVGTHPVGCEETELAIRVRQAAPQTRVVMEPAAIVHHRVSEPRLHVRYFLQRCYWEGVSKAVVAKAVGSGDALESEKTYTTRVLPKAFGRGLAEVLRGRPAGVLQSAAIAAGLVTTVLGYVRGRISGTTNTAPTLTLVSAQADVA